jgi:hypothetical protein
MPESKAQPAEAFRLLRFEPKAAPPVYRLRPEVRNLLERYAAGEIPEQYLRPRALKEK